MDRSAIISLHLQGKKTKEVNKLLGISSRTIRYVVARYRELGTTLDRPRSGRPVTVKTVRNREIIRKRVQRNPERSMRNMAKTLQINRESVRQIVKNELGLHPYKLSKTHFLTDKMKAARLEKAKKMLSWTAINGHHRILFTDEKVFTVQRPHNHQNDRQLLPKGSGKSQAKISVSRRHFPASVMVWAGICGNGKTPLKFIDKGVKIKAKNYVKDILEDFVDPWARNHFNGEEWCFQQDWAPAHGAHVTLNRCRELFPVIWDKEMWPSNSPDLNPLDYSVWSILESKVGTKTYDNIGSLKAALVKAWDEISVDLLADIVSNFTKRLRLCIKAKGDNFEKIC